MAARVVSMGLALLLAACSGDAEEAESSAAVANYVPPSVTSRLDFGGVIERSFHRRDVNRDDRLSAAELPVRDARRVLTRNDKDANGTLDATEWGDMMLARFDRIDTNRDGSVTSQEREAARAAKP